MIFETKEDFIKHYESLSDDFDKKVFLQEYIEACEKGDIDSLANEPDRLTADETNFKIFNSTIESIQRKSNYHITYN